jgi:hypothetical protein
VAHTHTQAKWSITQIHKIHDTNLLALTPFSSVALLEASYRAAAAEADDSNSNWSSTSVTQSHASNLPPPPPQLRMSRGTTLAERWMSL